MMAEEKRFGSLDAIELNLTASMVASNFNRLCIFYLLKKTPKNEMQVEKIASNLGISHRTALYHLDILQSYDLVEVREFRKKGPKLLRSVWGLSSENTDSLGKIFRRIRQRVDINKIEDMIMVNEARKSPRCSCQ